MKEELLNKIVKILDEKKAIDVKTINIQEKSSLADYMIIASGTSRTHIRALADNVEEELKKENIMPHKIEGYNSDSWILMDYLDVICLLYTSDAADD